MSTTGPLCSCTDALPILISASLAMMILGGLAVDLGGQVHEQQRAHDVAAQAARTGGQQVQAVPAVEGRYVALDTAAARQAAEEYLAAAGVEGTVTVSGGNTLTVNVTDVYAQTFMAIIRSEERRVGKESDKTG